jgi:hypothetical protein
MATTIAIVCANTLSPAPWVVPELAGKGIEYDWAAAKQCYRRQKLVEKRTKDKFRKWVIDILIASWVDHLAGAKRMPKNGRTTARNG